MYHSQSFKHILPENPLLSDRHAPIINNPEAGSQISGLRKEGSCTNTSTVALEFFFFLWLCLAYNTVHHDRDHYIHIFFWPLPRLPLLIRNRKWMPFRSLIERSRAGRSWTGHSSSGHLLQCSSHEATLLPGVSCFPGPCTQVRIT